MSQLHPSSSGQSQRHGFPIRRAGFLVAAVAIGVATVFVAIRPRPHPVVERAEVQERILSRSDQGLGSRPDPVKPAEERVLKIVSTQVQASPYRFTHQIFLGDRLFESMEALKGYLESEGRGVRIVYDVSCLGIPDRPMAQYEELEAFEQFCASHGIQFDSRYGIHEGRVIRLPVPP